MQTVRSAQFQILSVGHIIGGRGILQTRVPMTITALWMIHVSTWKPLLRTSGFLALGACFLGLICPRAHLCLALPEGSQNPLCECQEKTEGLVGVEPLGFKNERNPTQDGDRKGGGWVVKTNGNPAPHHEDPT